MKITAEIFHAHLKCPTKCWLRATGETSAGNTYPEWVKARNASYRTTQTARLIAELPANEVVRSPGSENVKGAKWRLASSLVVQASGRQEGEGQLRVVCRLCRSDNAQ
jgi:hypothetical protein